MVGAAVELAARVAWGEGSRATAVRRWSVYVWAAAIVSLAFVAIHFLGTPPRNLSRLIVVLGAIALGAGLHRLSADWRPALLFVVGSLGSVVPNCLGIGWASASPIVCALIDVAFSLLALLGLIWAFYRLWRRRGLG